jgi:hypothetical protein
MDDPAEPSAEPPPSLLSKTADAASTLLDGALVAMLGLVALTSCAPPQDLPWTGLNIGDPIGMATRHKLGRVSDDPAECLAFLRDQGVSFSPVPDKPAGEEGFCIVQGGLTLTQPEPRLSPARPLMTCQLAAAYLIWMEQSVKPSALTMLGQDVSQVDQFGSYSCRRVYNQSEGSPSTHAEAKALDVGGFRLKNGRRITVEKSWADPGPDGQFIHKVHDDACQVFKAVLSPDYNAAHANHLHLDVGPYRLCR